MKKHVVLLFLFSLCLFRIVNSQERIYFPYFEMINIDNEIELQYATSKLLKTYIEENHDYQIMLPKKPEGEHTPEDFLESIEKAKSYDAKYLLLGEINNIGKTAIISLSLYEVSSGNRIWSDLIKGIPMDDFDPVMSKIGRNFTTNVKARDDANIDDITTYEQEKELKLLSFRANTFTGLLMGGTYLYDKSFNTRIGLNFYYDISSVILNIDFDYSSNAMFNILTLDKLERDSFMRYTTLDLSMGVAIPFTRKKNTLYAYGGIDLGIIFQRRKVPELKENGSGLGFDVGAGYLIARNSTVNIRFDIGATIPTYKINDKYLMQFNFGIITSFAN